MVENVHPNKSNKMATQLSVMYKGNFTDNAYDRLIAPVLMRWVECWRKITDKKKNAILVDIQDQIYGGCFSYVNHSVVTLIA